MGLDNKTRNIIFKCVELALGITCTVLYSESLSKASILFDFGKVMAKYDGLTAYFYIVAVLLVATILDMEMHSHVNMMMCFVMAAMSLAGGSIIVDEYNQGFIIKTKEYDMGMAAGSIAIVNGVVFIVDIVMEFFANR